MAVATVVQAKYNSATTGSSVSITSAQSWAAPTAGNLLVVTAATYQGTSPGMSSSFGGAWTALSGTKFFYKIATGAETTVQYTWGASSTGAIYAIEFAGANTSSFPDFSVGGTGASANNFTVTGVLGSTLSSASGLDDILVYLFADGGASSGLTLTDAFGVGITPTFTNGTSNIPLVGYYIDSTGARTAGTVGTADPKWTWTTARYPFSFVMTVRPSVVSQSPASPDSSAIAEPSGQKPIQSWSGPSLTETKEPNHNTDDSAAPVPSWATNPTAEALLSDDSEGGGATPAPPTQSWNVVPVSADPVNGSDSLVPPTQGWSGPSATDTKAKNLDDSTVTQQWAQSLSDGVVSADDILSAWSVALSGLMASSDSLSVLFDIPIFASDSVSTADSVSLPTWSIVAQSDAFHATEQTVFNVQFAAFDSSRLVDLILQSWGLPLRDSGTLSEAWKVFGPAVTLLATESAAYEIIANEV